MSSAVARDWMNLRDFISDDWSNLKCRTIHNNKMVIYTEKDVVFLIEGTSNLGLHYSKFKPYLEKLIEWVIVKKQEIYLLYYMLLNNDFLTF